MQSLQGVKLVAAPVLELHRPSLGLTQLASRLRRQHGARVAVDIVYLNHEFATFMNRGRPAGAPDLYRVLLANEFNGFAEWFFRKEAFPETPDNTAAFFRRYFPAGVADEWKDDVLARRAELGRFLEEAIDGFGLLDAGIVGFASMFSQNVASFALARRLKQRRPDLVVVMGGPNCETPMGEEIARNVPYVDYVFSGPALVSFPEFVGHWLDGRMDRCTAIRGVFCKDQVDRAPAERIGEDLEIDAEVDLDYDSFFDSFERHFPDPVVPPMVMFETSRGCWWGERSHCTFCGLNGQGMEYRAMRADRAIALIQSLFARYRRKTATFCAVDNIMPVEYLKEVLPSIEPPPGTLLFFETKANLKDDELRVMARAGVTRIQPGIESLATSSLKLMAKGTTAFVNLKLLMNALRHGVWSRWNLLVGFPGEGDDVYAKYVADLPRVFHLQPPAGTGIVRFDRYSPYFMRAADWGLKLRPVDFYALIYPFPERVLANMAYYFFDANYAAEYMQTAARWIGRLRAVVTRWRDRWNAGDETPPPKLELSRRGRAAVVVDTRGEALVEHALDDAALRVLEFLDKPHVAKDVTAFGVAEGIDAAAALAFLDARGLVWNEGERWMGLVLMDPGTTGAPRHAREAREMSLAHA